MDIRNCAKCGKLFTYINSPICGDCVKKEEEIFEEVRDYIKENPNATVIEVSNETGVSTNKIYDYLREGKLEAVENIGFSLQCDRCGKAIKKGRYCDSCVLKMEDEIKEVFEKKYKVQGKMHTFKKDNK